MLADSEHKSSWERRSEKGGVHAEPGLHPCKPRCWGEDAMEGCQVGWSFATGPAQSFRDIASDISAGGSL